MATYRIEGAATALTAARVTETLDLTPSSSWEIGERPAPRSPGARASRWSLSSCYGPASGVELSAQLDSLLAILHPRREQLWKLAGAGYEMDWFCFPGSYATEHPAVLSRQLLQGLLAIPGEILLDIYHDEPDCD